MITPANRPYVPHPLPASLPSHGEPAPRQSAAQEALIPGWTEMSVWQPDGPGAHAMPRLARPAWPRWLAWFMLR